MQPPYEHPIGVSLGDMVPPERIGERARALEKLGYSHLMIPEDYWYEPALVCATLALGATDSVPIGTSIVSGLVRHPAVLAMEIAGISRAFPGRFRPGIGLGLPDWLRQMGLMPEKPVAALRESVGSIRSKSRLSAVRASSENAPASSTPVGPPPITTVVKSSRCFSGSVSVSARSKASRILCRIKSASLSDFNPGAC